MSVPLSLGVLGLSGYAIFRRSQNIQTLNSNKPLHPVQELNARNYIIPIIRANVNSLGTDLIDAIISTGWGNMSLKDIDNNEIISFVSESPSLTYGQLVKLDGLGVMKLCNFSRSDPSKSPDIFNLNTRKLITPLSKDALTLLESIKQKIGT